MEKTVQNLLQCLRNVICGEDVPLIAMSETEQEKFYQMSLAQDMAHLISAAVGNGENNIISEKYRKKFRQQENLAIYRYTCQELALEEIRTVFEQQKIFFLPLKGAVIRDFYPEAWMRTSSDIDILHSYPVLSTCVQIYSGENSTVCPSLIRFKCNSRCTCSSM